MENPDNLKVRLKMYVSKFKQIDIKDARESKSSFKISASDKQPSVLIKSLVDMGNTIYAFNNALKTISTELKDEPKLKSGNFIRYAASIKSIFQEAEKATNIESLKEVLNIKRTAASIKNQFNSLSTQKGKRSVPEIAKHNEFDLAFAKMYEHALKTIEQDMNLIIDDKVFFNPVRLILENFVKGNRVRLETVKSRIEEAEKNIQDQHSLKALGKCSLLSEKIIPDNDGEHAKDSLSKPGSTPK